MVVDKIFIRNICQEIIRESTNSGYSVNESFVRYYVDLLILDPYWKITTDLLLNRADVQKFVKHCVTVLSNQVVPSIVILKMQLYFNSHFEGREEMVNKHRNSLVGQLSPLLNEIIEVESLENEELSAKYHKKIIYYITLLGGIGNPTLHEVFKEVKAALGSIFFASDLQEFLALPKPDKEKELYEIMQLVAGIRIFNKDCQKGGIGIEDLPSMLEVALTSMSTDIQSVLTVIMDKIYLLTSAIENSYQIVYDTEKHSYYIEPQLPDNITIQYLEYYKDVLIMYRQFEIFVRKILIEVNDIKEQSAIIANDLSDALQKTHECVKYRLAIPVGQVYPLFKNLSDIWIRLQNEVIYLAKLNQILYNLNIYVGQFEIDDQVLVQMTGDNNILSDEERLLETTGMKIDTVSSGMKILQPNNIKDFDKLPIQYLGFCAYKLVETGGGLIPANPNMGIAESYKMYFAFSTLKCADLFGIAPETYILKAYELARRKPELINFLQLKKHLERLKEVGELVIKPAEVIVTYDADIQTETHPIPTKIDPNYKWNIWDWKRQALMFADISTRLTHSTQTHKSNYRNPAKAQTQELRDKNLQTKKDNYTNVPTLSNFIYGLRGRKDDKQFIIELTRPVHE